MTIGPGALSELVPLSPRGRVAGRVGHMSLVDPSQRRHMAVCDACGETWGPFADEDDVAIEVARHKAPHDGLGCVVARASQSPSGTL